MGNGARAHVNSKGKIPSTGGSEEGQTRAAASCRTASPTHYQLSYSGPIFFTQSRCLTTQPWRPSTSVDDKHFLHSPVRKETEVTGPQSWVNFTMVSSYLKLCTRILPSARPTASTSTAGAWWRTCHSMCESVYSHTWNKEFVCWLLNVPTTCKCISGTDLLRQFYVLPHWDVASQTFHLIQSQYTDTGPTSPSTDPIMPYAWQGSHWSANL